VRITFLFFFAILTLQYIYFAHACAFKNLNFLEDNVTTVQYEATVEQLKNKWNNLRAMYKSVRDAEVHTGAGADDVGQSYLFIDLFIDLFNWLSS